MGMNRNEMNEHDRRLAEARDAFGQLGNTIVDLLHIGPMLDWLQRRLPPVSGEPDRQSWWRFWR